MNSKYNVGVRIKKPVRSVIELSYRCNLTCETCNIWREDFFLKRAVTEPMGIKEIFGLHRQLVEIGIGEVTYVGGEPFLNNHLGEVILDARARSLKTVVVTNGTLLAEFMETHGIGGFPDVIIVSLDGPGKIHDRIRGRQGIFGQVTTNIRMIQRLRKKRGLSSPKIFLYMTVSTTNAPYVKEMFDIARKLDVHALRFQAVSTIGPAVSRAMTEMFHRDVIGAHSYDVETDLNLSPRMVEEVRDQLAEGDRWSRETGIRLLTEDYLRQNPAPDFCRFILRSLVINPAGDVLPCPMMTRYVIGNVRKQSLSDIWGNDRHCRFLETYQEFSGFPVCSRCCVEKAAGTAMQ